MRRRRDEWIWLGVFDRLRLAALDAYDMMIGLDLAELCADGCTTKAPCGNECAGRSPVDRGKQGLKGSMLTEGGGIRWPRSPPRPTTAVTLGVASVKLHVTPSLTFRVQQRPPPWSSSPSSLPRSTREPDYYIKAPAAARSRRAHSACPSNSYTSARDSKRSDESGTS
jgi:hypothetical protein